MADFAAAFRRTEPSRGAQTKGTVVEEIVARVNNDIITREDLEQARASLQGEVQDD